jgi:hypothetical protein
MQADGFTIRIPTDRPRIDWRSIRGQVDLPLVAETLLGPPDRREGGRLLWRCPFHEERTPSFTIQPGRHSWKCWGCNEHGDAADLVAKVEHLEFPHSARRAAEIAGVYLPDSAERRPPKPRPAPPPPEPSGLPAAEALRLVVESEARLWTDAGREALEYLRGPRGLADATIRAARLGWTPRVAVPSRDGRTYWPSGVVVPWFDGGRLSKVKLR